MEKGKFIKSQNSLTYSTGEYETILTKRNGEYRVEAYSADLEYAGSDPDYCEIYKNPKFAALDFAQKCVLQTRAMDAPDPAQIGKTAYSKAISLFKENTRIRD